MSLIFGVEEIWVDKLFWEIWDLFFYLWLATLILGYFGLFEICFVIFYLNISICEINTEKRSIFENYIRIKLFDLENSFKSSW